MRSGSSLLALVALSVLFAPPVVFASTFGAAGSILRVDEATFRVQLNVLLTQAGPFLGATCPDGWSGNCCTSTNFFLRVSGSFGMPTNVSTYDLYEVGEGFIRWISFHSYGAEVQFDFTASATTSSPLAVDYYALIDWWGLCTDPEGGSESHLNPTDDPGGGRLYADLPTRVGDSAPLRQVPVVVENRPWGAVKQLYRR